MAEERQAEAQQGAESVPLHQQGGKIGAGHAAAMGRLGLKELTQALPAFPDSSVRPLEEAGTFGNAPQYAPPQRPPTIEEMLNGYATRVPQDRGIGRDLDR